MKIFLTTILLVINLFSQDIDTNLQLTQQEKEFIEKLILILLLQKTSIHLVLKKIIIKHLEYHLNFGKLL